MNKKCTKQPAATVTVLFLVFIIFISFLLGILRSTTFENLRARPALSADGSNLRQLPLRVARSTRGYVRRENPPRTVSDGRRSWDHMCQYLWTAGYCRICCRLLLIVREVRE